MNAKLVLSLLLCLSLSANVLAANSYDVKVKGTAGGTVDPTGTITVLEGESRPVTITPAAGFHIVSVSVDGVSKGAATSVTLPDDLDRAARKHTVSAKFAINVYTVTASADTGGRIKPEGTRALKHGKVAKFTVTPGQGQRIAGLVVNGVAQAGIPSGGAFKFSLPVTADTIVTAAFVPADADGDGYLYGQGDCDDSNSGAYPGAMEVCGDGVDQDCTGSDLPCPLTVQTLGTDIEFLPQWFSSSDQLRVSLYSDSGAIIYTDSSDIPLKKQALDGSPTVALANRFYSAEGIALSAGSLYWIDDGKLYRRTPDGETILLATGRRAIGADVTADIVVDDNSVYWVDQAADQPCSPPCNWEIQKVPISGGNPVVLATANRRINSLKGDAGHVYWQEGSLEPWSVGCECGSKIKVVSKAGGTATVLVDGSLNGTLPPPPPGHIAGSWLPTGGIAVTDANLYFAVAGSTSYSLKSIPVTGGNVSDLATVPSSAGPARNAILNLTVNGADVYWLDTANSTLNKMSVAGGVVVTLAADLNSPSALATNATSAFWTETGAFVGCCQQMGAGSIRQIALAGGVVGTVVDNLDRPQTLAVDDASLVWGELWRIAKIPGSGGAITTLVSGISSNLARIAIAQSNVYILDGSLIKVVPLAGGTVEKLAAAHFNKIDDLSTKSLDIAADDAAVYWTVRDLMGLPVVQKVAIAGGTPIILASESGTPYPQDCYWRIALDDQNVYWSAGSLLHPLGCAVKKAPLNGGEVETLVDQAGVADFTVDGVHLYFSAGSLIQRMSVAGGAITSFVDISSLDQPLAWGLYADADSLYWLSFNWNAVEKGGTIGTVKKSSAANAWLLPIQIEMDLFLALEGLCVNDEGIFLSETQTGSIYRLY